MACFIYGYNCYGWVLLLSLLCYARYAPFGENEMLIVKWVAIVTQIRIQTCAHTTKTKCHTMQKVITKWQIITTVKIKQCWEIRTTVQSLSLIVFLFVIFRFAFELKRIHRTEKRRNFFLYR